MKKSTCITMLLAMLLTTAAFAGEGEKKEKAVVAPGGVAVEVHDGKTLKIIDERKLVSRGFLGVSLEDLTPALREYFHASKNTGVLVSTVDPESPADKAGLKAGDVIVSVDGAKVQSARDIGRMIADHKGGDQVRLEIIRNGAPQQLFATLIEKKRPQVYLRRVPEGDVMFWNDERSAAAMKKLQQFMDSPEWHARIESIGNCDDLRARISKLEKQLRELEKKLEKK